jgi:2-keto-4-pentenoate hydratase/2-oxohepta-3-ene-1,7-dioic acid hydratase in catechol pathway
MKLIRYGKLNQEKTGMVINGVMYDTSAFGEDYNEQFFETDGLKRLQQFVESNKNKLEKIPEATRLGSPVARPSKIVCIGLNYADHAKESGAQASERTDHIYEIHNITDRTKR